MRDLAVEKSIKFITLIYEMNSLYKNLPYMKVCHIRKRVSRESFFNVEDLIYELSPHDNKINKRILTLP